MAEIYNHI